MLSHLLALPLPVAASLLTGCARPLQAAVPSSDAGRADLPSGTRVRIVQVNGARELHRALDQANAQGGETRIQLVDGVYRVTRTLQVQAPGITIESVSGRRDAVTIEGDGMRADAAIGNVIRVASPRFTLRSVTVQRCANHLVQIAGESGAHAPHLIDCIFRDAFEQLVKISTPLPAGNDRFCDDGRVEGCVFEYPAGIGPQYYIAGVDGHNCRRWRVHACTFRNIASPSRHVAEQAVHFWGTSDIVVDGNVFIDCDRAIQFGLGRDRSVTGGVIRNNVIWHADNGHPYADVGISLESSANILVAHNTVLQMHPYPNAIEFRFPSTRGGIVANNLTNRAIRTRDGGSANVSHNLTDARPSWFLNPSQGNFRLKQPTPGVTDAGRTDLPGMERDISGGARPQGLAPDIGAVES